MNRSHLSTIYGACFALTLVALVAVPAVAEEQLSRHGISLVEELASPGLDMEISGIYPHPSEEGHYLALANRSPVYRTGQAPKLPEAYRGKLLTVNRQGEVVRAFDLVGGDYGGMAYGSGSLFVSVLEPAEILKVDPADGTILDRFSIAGPAGGLEFDAERGVLYAQLFVSHPHLAVVDVESGATIETLWSDESAMGLAKVDGDLLCSWANSFRQDALSELRLLDEQTGKVRSRIALDRVHTSLAPAPNGFIGLVSTDAATGEVKVARYTYENAAAVW